MENLKGGQNSKQRQSNSEMTLYTNSLHSPLRQNWCTNIENEYKIFLRMIMTNSNHEPQYTVPYAVLGSI